MNCNPSKVNALFSEELKVVNLGLQDFADNLKAKEVAVQHVRWTPPALGDDELLRLLDRLK